MLDEEKIVIFSKELALIKNENVRKFTEAALKVLPEYFWQVPASSSGKYHPQFDAGEGGLVRHTRATIAMLVQMFRNRNVFPIEGGEQAYAISALILHDGCKNGLGQEANNTISEHPACVVSFLSDKHPEVVAILSGEQQKAITGAILSHMGQWNTDHNTKAVILPEPETNLQKLVALCDYIVSRRFVEVNFEAIGY
jgi:hypothetical protein